MQTTYHKLANATQKMAYRTIDKQVDQLVDNQQLKEALALLQTMKSSFPLRLADTYYYRIWIFDKLNQAAGKLTELSEAAEHNVFFPMNDDFVNNISALPGFSQLADKSQRALTALSQTTQPRLDVYLPAAKQTIHTLLLILHGDGQHNESIYEVWPASPYLDSGYAVAYLQSPMLHCTNTYYWTNNFAAGREAIQQAVTHLKTELNITESHIILAGYSGGAMTAISAITHGTVTPKSCIAFLPHNGNYVGNVQNSDIPLTIFKAEFDQNIDTLLTQLKSKLDTNCFLLQNLSHDLPDDVSTHMLHLLKPKC